MEEYPGLLYSSKSFSAFNRDIFSQEGIAYQNLEDLRHLEYIKESLIDKSDFKRSLLNPSERIEFYFYKMVMLFCKMGYEVMQYFTKLNFNSGKCWLDSYLVVREEFIKCLINLVEKWKKII